MTSSLKTLALYKNGNAANYSPAQSLNGAGVKIEEIFLHPQLSAEGLKTLLQYSSDIITVISKEGIIFYDSPSIERILGYKQNELIGRNTFEFVHKEDYENVFTMFTEGLKGPNRLVRAEYRFRKADGSYIYLESVGTNFTDLPDINGIIVNSRDITERKEAEKNIKRLSAAVEQSSSTIVITNTDGNIEYVNKKFEDLTGYSKEEVLGKNPKFLKSGYTSCEEYQNLWETILTGNVWQGELKNRKKSGEFYWESVKITPVVDTNDRVINFIAIKDDITEKRLKEEELEKTLKEKELMLKEIHHRVKNNLQIVSSLLNLQAESVDDPKLKSQLTISQNRVRSMALIHQLLYRSANLSSINMEEYLYSLSSQLLATYNELKGQVKIKIDVTGVQFDIETAVPFGLLVNELITNSMKHGFPDGRKGEIKISLLSNEDDTYKLVYSDSGIGIPFTVVNGHVMSFGMYLIDTLVSQLDGKIEHVPSKGTTYNINFRGSNYQTRFHIS